MSEKGKPVGELRDVHKLEAFRRVYELRSFSKAGEVMFLSQPTISSHVACLEEDLGVRLFDRLGRQILPTAAADVLYVRAREVFDALDRAVLDIAMLRDRVAGEIALGSSTIPGHYVIPGTVAAFTALHAEVTFSFTVGDSSDILARILSGDLHLGVVGVQPDSAGLTAELLFNDEMVIIGPADNDPTVWTLEALLRRPWVMREKGSGSRMALGKAFRALGIDPEQLNVRAMVDSTDAAITMVHAGVGVTATSRIAAGELLAAGRVKDRTVPELASSRSFYLVRRTDRELFPAVAAFSAFLKESCRLLG